MILVELVTGQWVTSAEPELLKQPQIWCHIQRPNRNRARQAQKQCKSQFWIVLAAFKRTKLGRWTQHLGLLHLPQPPDSRPKREEVIMLVCERESSTRSAVIVRSIMIRTHTMHLRWIEDQAISQHEKLDSPTFRGNTECCCCFEKYFPFFFHLFTWWRPQRWWCKCRHLQPPWFCNSCRCRTRCRWPASSSCPCHRRCTGTSSAERSPSSWRSSSGKHHTWCPKR